MGAFYDITGRRYGRLLVVKLTEETKYGKRLWECACDCGKTSRLLKRALQSGNTRSCGCLIGDTARTHGQSRTALYRIWSGMHTRCFNPAVPQYKNYGGRGITVDTRWRGEDGFLNFVSDMGARPGPGYSVDRKDNDGPYSPENCRWATQVEQSNNQRSNIRITLGGETKTLMQWSQTLGVPYDRVWYRLKAGQTPAKALGVSS